MELAATHVLALAGAAGLSPWLTILVVAGLAAFTNRAALNAPFDVLTRYELLASLALLLGIELVLGNLPRWSRARDRLSLVVTCMAGAALAVGLASELARQSVWLAAAAGGLVAIVAGLARQRVQMRIAGALQPFGHLVTGIAANVLAGSLIATTLLLASHR
jgi:hypothetical protein